MPSGAAGLNKLAMEQMRSWAFTKVGQMVSARRDDGGRVSRAQRELAQLTQLGWFSHKLGEVDAARKLYEEVIESQTAQLGASHTDTLITKSNLANLQKQMGETDAARKLYEEVIEGQTAQLGASHTSTLTTKSNLAILQDEMGEKDAARKLYEEALEGFTAQLGASHQYTKFAHSKVATLLAS